MGISRHNWTSQGSDWRPSLEYYRAPWQCPRWAPFPSEMFIPGRKPLLPQKTVCFSELPVQTLPKQREAVSRHTGSIFPVETPLKSQPHLATLNMESTALKQHWYNIHLLITSLQLDPDGIQSLNQGSHSMLPWWDAGCASHQQLHSPLCSLCKRHWKVTRKLKVWSTQLSNFLY